MESGIFPGNSIIQALPHSLLQPFINHYVYRSLYRSPGDYIEKTMPFRPSNSIDFFIGDPFETLDCHTEELSPFKRCTIRGPRTCKKYIIRIQRQFISFTIYFHPTGLYRLLGISMEEFTNKAGLLLLLNTDSMRRKVSSSTCCSIKVAIGRSLRAR